MKNDEGEDMTRGKKEKEGSDLFLAKNAPPSHSFSFRQRFTKRNETKKNVRLYTPPIPTPSNGRTHLPFPSLDIAGYGPRITPKKKKKQKEKLVGLGWLVRFFSV